MKKNLAEDERILLGQFLSQSNNGQKLLEGIASRAATKWGISLKSVYTSWATVKNLQLQGKPVILTSKKVGVHKSKRVLFDVEKMKTIQYHKRNTIRSLGVALGVSKSTIGRWKKTGVIKAHSNAIKPTLNLANQISRLKFSVDAVTFDAQHGTKFKSMNHVIHIDEKWFYMTKCTEKYYIYPGEEGPYRSCQSKRFITKVMFLCAVSRPIYAENGELIFDGKVGLWPFTKVELAKRKSRNRGRGTPVTKAMDSINKEVTKEMLINQVIPAIKQKWPQNASKNIIIQWDNAPPHINNSDQDFRDVASADGFNIELRFQPPNSPDTNINDLGWFRSIESLKTDIQARTIDELVNAVKESFEKLSHEKLNKLFLTLESCLIEIMKTRGKNDYKIPHLKKDALQRIGQLPTDLEVDEGLVKDCIMFLRDVGHGEGLEGIMHDLELVHFSL